MGKNNSKGKLKRKTCAVFKVAGDKSLKGKGKAKKVKTNLRKMNFKTKEQTAACDEQLRNFQKLLYETRKKMERLEQSEPQPRTEKPAAADVDGAIDDIQRLWK